MLDSEETPGGCWAHFSVLRMPGYKPLLAGQRVELECEAADQDGYSFRALTVWPDNRAPQADNVDDGPSVAYRSEVKIAVDPPD